MTEKQKQIQSVVFIGVFAVAIVMSIALIATRPGVKKESARQTAATKRQSPFSAPGVGVISFEGVISMESTSFFGETILSPAMQIIGQFERLMQNPDVRAIVFSINSPGGSVVACQEIYDSVMRLKEQYPNKPIVVSFGEVAASGGYYLATVGDMIFANQGTLTANIGVILSSPNYKGLMDKLGMKVYTFTSGKNKDMGSAYRELRPDEMAYMQSMVTDICDEFYAVVRKAREGKLRAPESEIFDGRIMTGNQALKAGLIDAIGAERDAIIEAATMANLPNAENPAIIRDTDSRTFFLRFVQSHTKTTAPSFMSQFMQTYAGIPLYLYPNAVIGGE